MPTDAHPYTASSLAQLLTPPYPPALLALADGCVFVGHSIGHPGQSVGEVVFNTAMTGYQEILTDPSYCQQLVTLTASHVGNYGVNAHDVESRAIFACGLIIRDLPHRASNFRATEDLSSYLKANRTVAIAGIDTRALTRHLRTHGAQSGCITTLATSASSADTAHAAQQAVHAARACPSMVGQDLAQAVTCTQSYAWTQGMHDPACTAGPAPLAPQQTGQRPLHVVVCDFGVKHNILRMLVSRGCKVTVMPAKASAAEVLAAQPDGVFLSNGPGDPAPCHYAMEMTRVVLSKKIPLFGICLGHQILALACGAKTFKMKFGHHGANHPVVELATGKVAITSQNHGFAVDAATLPTNLRATHRSLFDGTLQGIEHTDAPAFGFQGHPEASPGPQESAALFDKFTHLMRAHGK